jgi:pyridoxine 5-phosphate synthase
MSKMDLKLGVNIDHVATLRQVRRAAYPSPLEAARLCMKAGAQGVTVHLREDRRHIQDADVYAIRQERNILLNLEMANVPSIVKIALDVRPDEVCLVPERRQELTTEGGLDVAGQESALRPTVEALARAGIKVSLFIEAVKEQLEAAADLGVPVVELHTGAYCEADERTAPALLTKLIDGARRARDLGLQVNAGHGINLRNIAAILRMPHLDTLNIGHSIVARAVFVGLENAVTEMRTAMSSYQGGEA